MNSKTRNFIIHFWLTPTLFFSLILSSFSLNSDGILLLSFKYSILSDPLSVLDTWNYDDDTPCSWTGITCTGIGNSPEMFRVTSLVLPGSQLLGSIPPDIFMIEHLRHLDLSNNFLNGSLPSSIFNASELQVLSLSNNVISGELPELVSGLKNLNFLNVSDNALFGKVPESLSWLQNLTVVSLRSNYFFGRVPKEFNFVQVLDLSSNLINGSLPLNFGGDNLRYLNLSYNKIPGSIPTDFAMKIPENSTIDLSFNNLTGPIPNSVALINQKTEFFTGNENLCGKPLKRLCSFPSTLASPPNESTTSSSSPAIAAIPKTISTNPVPNSKESPNSSQTESKTGIKPGKIAAIAMGDIAGIIILSMIILYLYHLKKRKNETQTGTKQVDSLESPESKRHVASSWPSCLTIKAEETTPEATSSTDLSSNSEEIKRQNKKRGVFVTVDGERELELETLLKASAYILGTGSSNNGSIVYKAVIEDGTAFAVRRIGESGIGSAKEFEKLVRGIGKLKHPNLVRVKGFYWGEDEKLVVYDYVSNGSLASFNSRKLNKPPCNILPLEVRLKIARGIARGIAIIHDKKQVHGNVKPSNILLNADMEPLISDLGLDRLVFNNNASGSARFYGNEGVQDRLICGSPGGSSVGVNPSAYQAPESLKNLKPNPKSDVYSFGIILLELLTGRVHFSESEMAQLNASLVMENKIRVLKIADVAIMGDVEGKEEAMLACFELGFSCASFVAQKRPNIKEAVKVLDKITLDGNY